MGRWLAVAIVAFATVLAAAPAVADVVPPANLEPYSVFTVGDSYAAGEGAPQQKGTYNTDGGSPNPREDWDTSVSGNDNLVNIDTERCHRSPFSTSGVATGHLKADFPDIVVLFKSVACSGGSIVEGFALKRDAPTTGNSNDKPEPGGVLRSYSGEDFLENFPDPRPATPAYRPQLNQIDEILAGRAGASFKRLDALIVNAGGNDAGFSSFISACADVPLRGSPGGNCSTDQQLIAFRDARLALLDGLYDRLDDSLESNPSNSADAQLDLTATADHRPRAVLITAAPRIARKGDVSFCNSEPAGDETSKISSPEAQFVENTLRVPLNQAMATAAADNDWTFVSDHVADFTGHAICQDDRWINTNNDALKKQGELPDSASIPQNYSGGWVHPNQRGYSQMGGALYRQLAKKLVARFTPTAAPAVAATNQSDRVIASFVAQGEGTLATRSGNYRAVKLLGVGADGVNSSMAEADGFRLLGYSDRGATYNRTGRYLALARSCAPLARNAAIGCGPPRQLRMSTLVPQTPIEVVAKAAQQSAQSLGPVRVQWRHANPGAAHDTTFSRVRVTGSNSFDQTFTVSGRGTAKDIGNLPSGIFSVSVAACNQQVGCSTPTAPASITTGSITGFDAAAIRVASYSCDRNAITWDAPQKVLFGREGTGGSITLSDPDRLIVPTCIDEPVGRLFIKPRRLRTRPARPARLTVGWEHPNRWGELRTVTVRLRRGRRIVATLVFNRKKRTLALARGARSRGRRARIPRRSRRTLRAGPVKILVSKKTFRRPTLRARAIRLRLRLVLGRSLAGRRLSVEIGATGEDGARQAFTRAGTIRVRRR